MNYSLHYNRLINRAPKNKPTTYITEGHHVIPRCIGGTDLDGIVYLTPEEHYIAHLLLLKMYPNEPKLIYAASMMTVNNCYLQRSNNKRYGWLRKKYIAAAKIFNSNRKHTEITKQKISQYQKGRPKSENHRKKLAEANKLRKGIPRSPEVKAKIKMAAATRKGKTFVEQFGETRAKEIMKKAVLTKIKNNTTGKGVSRPYMKGVLNPSKRLEVKEKMSKFAKQKPFKCTHCEKSFNIGNYTKHINSLKRKSII